jgi:hypothetical protein
VCPRQSPRTAVIVVLGQSNAANYADQTYTSLHGDRILNVFDGRCFIAQSPLLGASGAYGEQWTALGNELIESGMYERVVLVPAAIGGSASGSWSHGDLTQVLEDTLTGLRDLYTPTEIVWHQGEADFWAGTPEHAYRENLRNIVNRIRTAGVKAPFYVTVASRCTDKPVTWFADNPVARAQKHIADQRLGIRVGVDADAILSTSDRYDDCHLAKKGIEKLSHAWRTIFATKP